MALILSMGGGGRLAPGLPGDVMSHDSREPSRREFMRAAGLALAGGAMHAPAPLRGQEGPTLLPPYVTDIDGSGAINASDREIVSTALYAQRGFGLAPRSGFDYRADVFGRAVVEPLVVDSVTHSIQRYGESTLPTPRRPITVAWHYGWYNTLNADRSLQGRQLSVVRSGSRNDLP